MKQHFFYPPDLVNTKTIIPLRVAEDSVYIHHYSPPLWGIVVYYIIIIIIIIIIIVKLD